MAASDGATEGQRDIEPITGSTPMHVTPPTYEPTPEEIAEKCAAFQRGWSDEVREMRIVGTAYQSRPVEVPAGSLRAPDGRRQKGELF